MKNLFFIYFIFALSSAQADEFFSPNNWLNALLLGICVFLLTLIFLCKNKMKTTCAPTSEQLKTQRFKSERSDKIALNYDLQEVLLYCFKTISYEAGQANNSFLLRQNYVRNRPKNAQPHTIADSVRPSFLPSDFMNQREDLANLSEQISAAKVEFKRPMRQFFGDYTDVINAICTCFRLLNSEFSNSVICMDLELLSGADDQMLLGLEFSVQGPSNQTILSVFSQLLSPQTPAAREKIEQFYAQMDAINGAKCYIKDTSTRSNCLIVLNISLSTAPQRELAESAPQQVLKALVVHDNPTIAQTIIDNLNDFNVECVYNQNAEGLVKLATDGVNFPYRALLLEAGLFASLAPGDQEALLLSREQNYFELVIILNNHQAAAAIASVRNELNFLPLPYTIDNIRALVGLISAQAERQLA